MFKHTVSYVDFNSNQRTEDLYFHLSLPEVTRLEAEIGMGFEDHIKQLTEKQDLKTLLGFLERILLMSYGQKTSDGRSFVKNDKSREEFEHSQAYAEMFEQVITDKDLAYRFGTGVADNGKQKKNEVQPKVVSAQPEPTQSPE